MVGREVRRPSGSALLITDAFLTGVERPSDVRRPFAVGAGKPPYSKYSVLPTADFSVIDPHRMMRTDDTAEESTRPIVHAWRARVNINATRCENPLQR
jgi:hypothetical protein